MKNYIIITYFPCGAPDFSFYETFEEALEDYHENDTDYYQELYKIEKIGGTNE